MLEPRGIFKNQSSAQKLIAHIQKLIKCSKVVQIPKLLFFKGNLSHGMRITLSNQAPFS